MLPTTQKAVAIASPRSPLIQITVPVHAPSPSEITLKVSYTASTPLDLHRADGGLLITTYPSQSGSGGASGTVVAVGADVHAIQVGDKVSVFAFHGGKEANHQEYITCAAYLASKIPVGISEQQAATVNVNLCTVFHSLTRDLGLALPWPAEQQPQRGEAVLVWGASSSVGLYAVQVLRHWGYANVLAVSGASHHAHLEDLGARKCFDYRRGVAAVVDEILAEGRTPFILDCIGSLEGSLAPLKRIARRGDRVAVMLPVIVRDASVSEEPVYEMDVANVGGWEGGVEVRGVRTHFYLENEFFKEHLQPEIVPTLLAQGVVQPNRYREIEGKNMVERAQKALDELRNRSVSGERLVWRVSDDTA
ncbi:putative alcohol dehydrogenase [Metarhizium anisopliae]|uniref:Enoyl reductase (ER) domain-containing protein n=2 Tax=Metarhizium TaxID=5529 RepID=A0A0D9P1H0_METAN